MDKTEETQQVSGMDSGKKRRGKKSLLLLLLLFLAAAGIGWWYYQDSKMDQTTRYWFDKMAKDGTLEGKTPQEVQGILNAVVEEGMFHVSINARAVFPDGKGEGSLGFENVSENRYYCRVVLRMDQDESVLYKSEGLKPGQYIDKIKLNKKLPAGTYPCTAEIIATDPDSLEDMGRIQVKLDVIITG